MLNSYSSDHNFDSKLIQEVARKYETSNYIKCTQFSKSKSVPLLLKKKENSFCKNINNNEDTCYINTTKIGRSIQMYYPEL